MSEKRKFDGIWDARRLLQSYLVYADENGYIPNLKTFEKNAYDIKLQRLIAVLRAYGRDEKAFYKGERKWEYSCLHELRSKTCSVNKLNQLRELLKGQQISNYDLQFVDSPDFFQRDSELDFTFQTLFAFRKKFYDLERCWSGILECSRSTGILLITVKRLSNNQNIPLRAFLDEALLLLMGDDYDKSFTEEELFAFDYPDVTTEELDELEYDW